jgi:hypothetical protein
MISSRRPAPVFPNLENTRLPARCSTTHCASAQPEQERGQVGYLDRDPVSPFAFLATYTSRLSAHGKAQHQPLSQALAEFSGARSKVQLLSLLRGKVRCLGGVDARMSI